MGAPAFAPGVSMRAMTLSMTMIGCMTTFVPPSSGASGRRLAWVKTAPSISGADELAGVERIELDPEVGVREFGADKNVLDAVSERGLGLGAGGCVLKEQKSQKEKGTTEKQGGRFVLQDEFLREMILLLS